MPDFLKHFPTPSVLLATFGALLSAGTSFAVGLTDAPDFGQETYTLALIPAMSIDTVVARITAEDPQGDPVEYTLLGEVPFTINAAGEIRAAEVLNHNQTQSYSFQVEASDGAATDTVAITARFVSDAGVRLERWTGISGSNVQDLTDAVDYQNDPGDVTSVIAQLDVPNANASNFGQRLTAILVPEVSGEYVFGLTSDDHSQFSISLSGDVPGLAVAVSLNGWTAYQDWSAARESESVRLEAGCAYPVEILHKEGGGGDHVSLGWRLADSGAALELVAADQLFQQYLDPATTVPEWLADETDYLISGMTAVGEVVAMLSAVDRQGDPLSYAIVGDVPFDIDDLGRITVEEPLPEAGGDYTFEVSVSDQTHAITTTLRIRTSALTSVEDALASGAVDSVTAEELLEAALASIETGQQLLLSEKYALFDLELDGSAKADGSSLLDIDWNPTHDAAVLQSTFGLNAPVLLTNAVTDESYTVQSREIGIIGEEPGRYMVLGGNPMRNWHRNASSVNDGIHSFLQNSLAWLTERDDLQSSSFEVVIAHESQNYYFPDQEAIRGWLDSYYPGVVQYNEATAANDDELSAALASGPDLLIISQHGGTDPQAIADTVEAALQAGVGVLYLHYDGNITPLGEALFDVFHVQYDGDNYWRRLQLVDYDATAELVQALPEAVGSIHTMLTHFQAGDYDFDWTLADGESVSAVSGLQASFLDGAAAVRSIMTQLDADRIDLFSGEGFEFQKLLALLGDSYRQDVRFPMDKIETDEDAFLKSLFADYAVYNYRSINPTQADMGNFSRSDFSHITPISKTVDLESKRNFRSAGVYALPGQTVRVTRLDSSEVGVKVFVNTQRSGSTHEWASFGYKRPKFLKSPSFEVASGESIELTSPYGGPLQVAFDTNDLPVQLSFENVGEHAYWRGSEDDLSFEQKLNAAEYDWAEIASPAFEVHSTLMNMNISVADWETPQLLASATMRYTHNFPHVLAGFQGPGIDVVPEIHDFAAANGWTIERLDLVKHMNADQATCGYGCSGNPYDAYWNFSPTGHGDLHELGHGLEKSRFRMPGWETHSTTNPYSYYSKTQYYKDTGIDPTWQSLPFESVFGLLQSSVLEDDPAAWLQTNLWDDSGWSQQFMMLIQILMIAENEGVLEDGWHGYARLHMLEREFARADNNDEAWLEARDSLGFSQFTREEAKALNNIDWMTIAVSYVTGLDYREFFKMYGYEPSAEAETQVASFAAPEVSRVFCLSTGRDYGKGQGFNQMVLPVDGQQSWPEETDTDGDQQWDYFDEDDDNDQISDAFERTHNLDPLSEQDAAEDADGDRMNNRAEYIAGTNPREVNSRFVISAVDVLVTGERQVSWSGVVGRMYSVWGSDDLGQDFIQIREPQLSAGGVEIFTDTDVRPDAYFYQVEVTLP